MARPAMEPFSASALPQGPSPTLILVFAVATGTLVANLYYAQPLIALIAPEIGMSPGAAGFVTSVTQLGYALGLFLVVPLADLVENRRLVMIGVACSIIGLLGTALARSAPVFLAASLLAGLSSTAAQVLVPFAAHLAPPERRGRVIGAVMSGLLTGIMLARPLASTMAAAFGWRAVFWLSAGLMAAIGLMLRRMMPHLPPRGGLSYGRALASTLALIRDQPALRRRAIYQALCFAAFNLFWTASPLVLARHFGLGQPGIALFALAGAGGALAAPLAGRLADRGLARHLTGTAFVVLTLAFLAAIWAVAASSLVALTLLAVLIDAAVQINQITGQRVIFSLPAEARGRVNAAYMTTVFMVGAFGSSLGAALFHDGGWNEAAGTGVVIGLVLLGYFATELRRRN